jgi:hypothetical protein
MVIKAIKHLKANSASQKLSISEHLVPNRTARLK